MLGCADSPEHRFLADHVVDNRILMPAVSFVVTAWHAAAEAAGVPPNAFPAAIEDFHVHQAVVAQKGQKVTLGVQITADRHFHVSRSPWRPFHCCPCTSAMQCRMCKTGCEMMLRCASRSPRQALPDPLPTLLHYFMSCVWYTLCCMEMMQHWCTECCIPSTPFIAALPCALSQASCIAMY